MKTEYEIMSSSADEVATVLAEYNRWRKSMEDNSSRSLSFSPIELGVYIDRAIELLKQKDSKAKAVPSKPPRNCDRFVDELDAQLEFLNEVWLISVDKDTMLERDKFENWTNLMKDRYVKWLFAEVKGEPQNNAAKKCEADDWLNQLVSLINGEISHYMSQGVDCFSVDCGPWHIQYDKINGENDESK